MVTSPIPKYQASSDMLERKCSLVPCSENQAFLMGHAVRTDSVAWIQHVGIEIDFSNHLAS